jgi:hypothetical protein
MAERSGAASQDPLGTARDSIPIRVQGSMGPPDSFSPPLSHTAAPCFDDHSF